MDNIAGRFADKILPVQSREPAIPIDKRTAAGREPTARIAVPRAVAVTVIFCKTCVLGPLLPPGCAGREGGNPFDAGGDFELGSGGIRIADQRALPQRRAAAPRLARGHGEKRLLHLRFPVVVTVCEKDNVGRAGHDNPAACRDEPVGGREIGGSNIRPRSSQQTPDGDGMSGSLATTSMRKPSGSLNAAGLGELLQGFTCFRWTERSGKPCDLKNTTKSDLAPGVGCVRSHPLSRFNRT